MPTILSKGYQIPTNGEKVTWWANIIYNFTRLNNHIHDGIDSQLILATALTKSTSAVSATNWVASGVSTPWKQTVTTPTDVDLTKHPIAFKDTTNGERIFPKFTVLTSTTFDLYVNDNTLNLSVIYG